VKCMHRSDIRDQAKAGCYTYQAKAGCYTYR
jgi:hypothetical protein